MYDKSILAKSTGASLGVVAVVGLLFLSTGTAFAMPVAGIGGFTIDADTIEGEGMIMYPGTTQAENTSDVNSGTGQDVENKYPSGVIELDSTSITGMELKKVFNMQKYTSGVVGGQARLIIQANGNVESDTLLMKTPQLKADKATFQGLEVKEQTVEKFKHVDDWIQLSTDKKPEGPITQPAEFPTKKNYTGGDGGPGLMMEDPHIRATYLATDQITMPGMGLEIQYDPDFDDDYEWASM